VLTDDMLQAPVPYDTNVKMNPPLREAADRDAMLAGLADGSVDVIPSTILHEVEVVAGPVTGGALLAHTIAGLLDSRRELAREPMLFAPFVVGATCDLTLSRFYQQLVAGRRVLLVDDVRNTGQTQARCASMVKEAGGTVIATAEIYDRMESTFEVGVPNYALAEYRAPEIFAAATCPLCAAGQSITAF
jgi:orotate phosphoribosyltransferase